MKATFNKDVRNWDMPGKKAIGNNASRIVYKKDKEVEVLCTSQEGNAVILTGKKDNPVVDVVSFSTLALKGHKKDIPSINKYASEYGACHARIYLGNGEYAPMGTLVYVVHFYQDLKKAVIILQNGCSTVKHVYTDSDIYHSTQYTYD